MTPRPSQLGIQMLPTSLKSKLFPIQPHITPLDNSRITLAKQHLSKFQLLNKNLPPLTEPSMDPFLPDLVVPNGNIRHHFQILGIEQREPFFTFAKNLSLATLPPLPSVWEITKSGWIKYNEGSMEQIEYPNEECMVLDTEVLFKKSPFPILCIAVSQRHWYSWISPQVFNTDAHTCKDELLNLGPRNHKKLIVGHHIAFDRARIQQEYHIESTEYAYLDTLSLHLSVGGLSSQQRGTWLKYKKVSSSSIDDSPADEENKDWKHVGSTNSLLDVYKFYTGKEIDKDLRKSFETMDYNQVRDNLPSLLSYCAMDVSATHQVFCIVFDKFLKKCPHSVSFAGILHLGKGYLPVTQEWKSFIQKSQDICNINQITIEKRLLELAIKALENELESRKDIWLSRLDWNLLRSFMKKLELTASSSVLSSVPTSVHPTTLNKYKNEAKLLHNLLKENPNQISSKKQLYLFPNWFRDLWDSSEKKIKLTTSKRVTPYLLKLEWLGYPLYYTSSSGWTWRVSKQDYVEKGLKDEILTFEKDPESKIYDPVASMDTEHVYLRLPHPEGEGKNCGNPLSKSFLSAFEQGTLTSKYPDAKEILQLNAECSYWVSARQRIFDQFVVWNDSTSSSSSTSRCSKELMGKGIVDDKGRDMGVILPQSIVMGTVTRRSVEPTWMTAANAKKNRIGSELKSQIKSPKGYCFVGADVDSQELWIASLFGDAQFGCHGATAIGFMTLQGSKSLKTDLHSVTGNIIGVSRDSAKVFNYSRIYGAGLKHAVQLLLKNNPGISRSVAEKNVLELYKQTKGSKTFLKPYQQQSPQSKQPQYKQTQQILIQPQVTQVWKGGSESYMFNSMEWIARSKDPRTPVLGCGIPDSLLPIYAGNNFMTSRINWVVQSSGVDYLHLLLVSMNYLIKRLRINARFLISIHDEVRFMVKEEDSYLAVLALQISNLWVRCMFSHQVGMYDLPLTVAFFSLVEIDHCLRKEAFVPCITPSNQEAIQPGVSLDIYQLLEKLDPKKDYFGPELPSIKELVCGLKYEKLKLEKEPSLIVSEALLKRQF